VGSPPAARRDGRAGDRDVLCSLTPSHLHAVSSWLPRRSISEAQPRAPGSVPEGC
jgi:hypothetical protein